jgi:hypothetical protein
MQCGYADLPLCGGELSVGCGEVGAVCVVGVGRSVDNISLLDEVKPALRGCLKIRREVKNQAVSLRSMLRIMAM